ncbi:MAG: hypothetical protein U9R02_05470 [Thermodesulfobacteriota bacterium]|nr:hypothetical protein [Thermodesulfobacteriota bacterium]
MPELANQPKADFLRGFTVPQVAEKHGWPEPMVWSLALEGKDDLQRFKALNWGLWTWDLWNWNDCLPREIHVNDREAYFTGVISVSEMTGLPAIALAQRRQSAPLKAFAQARRAGAISKTPLPKMRPG